MARETRIRGLTDHQWMNSNDDSGIFVQTVEWDRATSMQCVAADLGLVAAAGSSTAASPAYLAAGMFNIVFGTTAANINLTATQNIVAGLIAKYDHIGTNASTYPGAAFIAEIGDGSTAADAAVLVVMGGDTTLASCPAAFRVDSQSSIVGSAFTYGIDFEGPGTHDGYVSPRYSSAFIRMGGRTNNAAGQPVTVADVCVLAGTAAPTDGTSGTGAAVAGAGSLYIRQSGSTSNCYINTNTTASPTWVSVGTLT